LKIFDFSNRRAGGRHRVTAGGKLCAKGPQPGSWPRSLETVPDQIKKVTVAIPGRGACGSPAKQGHLQQVHPAAARRGPGAAACSSRTIAEASSLRAVCSGSGAVLDRTGRHLHRVWSVAPPARAGGRKVLSEQTRGSREIRVAAIAHAAGVGRWPAAGRQGRWKEVRAGHHGGHHALLEGQGAPTLLLINARISADALWIANQHRPICALGIRASGSPCIAGAGR